MYSDLSKIKFPPNEYYTLHFSFQPCLCFSIPITPVKTPLDPYFDLHFYVILSLIPLPHRPHHFYAS
ncbi:hypothetical protein POVWA2_003760 [Plasmodium ovale wallikeri]|uniref:Uncharacterized protein n=1 Tax=Plasmodium ovale wallikeri TaxID=864142 RepID=A0A1A8YGR3_PLAOA|nr:hypothetical protein POVWA1_003620 [Plasmodium ovale wallikeri]SBT31359.1 hypothetical protein POVWA2_003760 [Plasmodium ovale wallikeri]